MFPYLESEALILWLCITTLTHLIRNEGNIRGFMHQRFANYSVEVKF